MIQRILSHDTRELALYTTAMEAALEGMNNLTTATGLDVRYSYVPNAIISMYCYQDRPLEARLAMMQSVINMAWSGSQDETAIKWARAKYDLEMGEEPTNGMIPKFYKFRGIISSFLFSAITNQGGFERDIADQVYGLFVGVINLRNALRTGRMQPSWLYGGYQPGKIPMLSKLGRMRTPWWWNGGPDKNIAELMRFCIKGSPLNIGIENTLRNFQDGMKDLDTANVAEPAVIAEHAPVTHPAQIRVLLSLRRIGGYRVIRNFREAVARLIAENHDIHVSNYYWLEIELGDYYFSSHRAWKVSCDISKRFNIDFFSYLEVHAAKDRFRLTAASTVCEILDGINESRNIGHLWQSVEEGSSEKLDVLLERLRKYHSYYQRFQIQKENSGFGAPIVGFLPSPYLAWFQTNEMRRFSALFSQEAALMSAPVNHFEPFVQRLESIYRSGINRVETRYIVNQASKVLARSFSGLLAAELHSDVAAPFEPLVASLFAVNDAVIAVSEQSVTAHMDLNRLEEIFNRCNDRIYGVGACLHIKDWAHSEPNRISTAADITLSLKTECLEQLVTLTTPV